MKKNIFLLSAFIFIMIISTACSSNSSSGSSSGVNVLYCQSNGADVFRASLEKSATDYADKNNISITVKDAENNVEEQLKQIKSAKDDGFTVIICNLVDSETAQQMIAAANDLPIVFINNAPRDSVLEENKYIYLGSSERVAGGLQGDYLTDYFKEKSKTSINAILFRGEATHPATLLRSESVKNKLLDNGINVNFVFDDRGDWSREKAKNMFLIFLKTEVDFDCVICNNDEMAMGVIDACKEAGIDPTSFPIVGIDGTTDGCNAILNDEMAFTVYQSAIGQGSSAVEAAAVLSEGDSISDIEYSEDNLFIWIPFESITKDNVKDYLN